MKWLVAGIGIAVVACGGDGLVDDIAGISHIEQAATMPSSVYLQRAIYRSGLVSKTTPGFEAWADNDVAFVSKSNTYIAKIWTPSPSNVKYVFVFSAGQQPLDEVPWVAGGDNKAVATGQPGEWRSGFWTWKSGIWRSFNPNSFVGDIIKNEIKYPYSPSNTVLAVAFKSGLPYNGPSSGKTKVINAYYDWLASLTNNYQKVELVYLGGSSRGGAWAAMLGDKIRGEHGSSAELARMRILVSALDGVPNRDQNELYTKDWPVDNRLSTSSYHYGFYADLENFYKGIYRTNVFLYQTVGGRGAGWRGFCSGSTMSDARNDHLDKWGFYTQKWVNHGHGDLCENWYTNTATYNMRWFYRKGFDLTADHMAAHDFDGDGKDDLLWGNGQRWFIRSAAKDDWKMLPGTKTQRVPELQFGHFGGASNKMDVVTVTDGAIRVSFDATNSWMALKNTSAKAEDIAVGDFDGDGKDDVFWSPSPGNWFVAHGGTGSWKSLASYAIPATRADLRFADFNGDGKTDVFWVNGYYWMVSLSGLGFPLVYPILYDPTFTQVNQLAIGDFNNDNKADVLKTSSGQMLLGGTSYLQSGYPAVPRGEVVIGEFKAPAGSSVDTTSDVLWLQLGTSQRALPRLYPGGTGGEWWGSAWSYPQ